MSTLVREPIPLVECLSLPDTFAEGMHSVEPVGSCARVIYYVTRTECGEQYRVPVCSIVMPRAALLETRLLIANLMSARALARMHH